MPWVRTRALTVRRERSRHRAVAAVHDPVPQASALRPTLRAGDALRDFFAAAFLARCFLRATPPARRFDAADLAGTCAVSRASALARRADRDVRRVVGLSWLSCGLARACGRFAFRHTASFQPLTVRMEVPSILDSLPINYLHSNAYRESAEGIRVPPCLADARRRIAERN